MKKEYMDIAFEEAKIAFDNDEVPIGVVIVKNDKIIAKAHNNKNSDNLVTSHAEIIAIEQAERQLNNWRLDGCDIYITLDPCPMCASAIKQARVNNVFCALSNLDSNNYRIINDIFNDNDYTNKSVVYKTNLFVDKSKELLSSFFENKRK